MMRKKSLFLTTENPGIPPQPHPKYQTLTNKSFSFLSIDSGSHFLKYIYSQIIFPLGYLNKFLWQ